MKNKKDSNVLLGISGATTALYSLFCLCDGLANPSENEELNKVNNNISGIGIIVGCIEILIAFKEEKKERKEAEEMKKELEARKKAE